jgi:Holliday junction DNA helicase RuvA
MLAFIRGTVKAKGQGFVVVETGGLGYQVFVNSVVYADCASGATVELYLHHHVREDAQDLYGFANFAALAFFKLLIGISGVGPKSAQGVLAMADIDELKASIAAGDPSLLTKVSGIGKKTAERIVLELRGKMDVLSASGTPTAVGSPQGDQIDALVALGYSLQQARDALRAVDPAITDSGDRIRAALRGLGK